MRILTGLFCLVVAASLVGGCSGKKDDVEPPKITMPVNNDAPEAKNAGAPPPETNTPTPGQMKKNGRRS